jgi:hypothetical protein
MTFESRIIAFADRFLSTRTFDLIVEPALADLHYDQQAARRSLFLSRCAVLRAVAGGLRDEIAREAGIILRMTLLAISYFLFPMALGLDLFNTWADLFAVVSIVSVLSLTLVMGCFWPARHTPRAD